jgi:restriction endonuclease S subunit
VSTDIRLRILTEILKDYLYSYLISQKFHSDVIKNSSGGVRQANVSGQNILKIQIPIPKKNLQQNIIIKFNENLNFIELSKKVIFENEKLIKEKISKIWSN